MNIRKRKIIVANGDKTGRANLSRDIAALGFQVRATDDLSTVLGWVNDGSFSLVVLDVDLFDAKQNGFDVLQHISRIKPECPVITVGGENTILSSLLSARFGAIDFFAKPFNFPLMASTITSAISKPARPKPRPGKSSLVPLIAHSSVMQPVIRMISKSARSSQPVLIRGEAGVGKFLVAEIIHQYTKNTDSKFLILQPTTSLSDLKQWLDKQPIPDGSTVVFRRLDRFESAAQYWILDWLDRNEMNNVIVQVIATLPMPPLENEGKGGVEQSLLDRLSIVQITIPPLRQRHDDIAALATTFLEQASNFQMNLTKESEDYLRNLPWSGNARQLKNLMKQAFVLYSTPVLDIQQLNDLLEMGKTGKPSNTSFDLAISTLIAQQDKGEVKNGLYPLVLSSMEYSLLGRVLGQTHQNQVKAAKILGINRNTLRKKIKYLNLNDI